jgi:hypothetical protein
MRVEIGLVLIGRFLSRGWARLEVTVVLHVGWYSFFFSNDDVDNMKSNQCCFQKNDGLLQNAFEFWWWYYTKIMTHRDTFHSSDLSYLIFWLQNNLSRGKINRTKRTYTYLRLVTCKEEFYDLWIFFWGKFTTLSA